MTLNNKAYYYIMTQVGVYCEIKPGLDLFWANIKCMLGILWKLGLLWVCTGLIQNVYCKTPITILLNVFTQYKTTIFPYTRYKLLQIRYVFNYFRSLFLFL